MRRISSIACVNSIVFPLLARRWYSLESAKEGLEVEKSAEHTTNINIAAEQTSQTFTGNNKNEKNDLRSTSATSTSASTRNRSEKSSSINVRRMFTNNQINAFSNDIKRVIEEQDKEEAIQEQQKIKQKLQEPNRRWSVKEREHTQKHHEQQQQQQQHYHQKEKYEMIYDVPIVTPHVVGRERVLRELWQNILVNEHCQIITGVNGMGKSSILAEFCERAKESKRFTCIKWFQLTPEPVSEYTLTTRAAAPSSSSSSTTHSQTNTPYASFVRIDHRSCQVRALRRELTQFISAMKGRTEKDVLLVFDEVSVPEEVFKLIPRHKNLYVIMTMSAFANLDRKLDQNTKIGVPNKNKNNDVDNTSTSIVREKNFVKMNESFDVNNVKIVLATPLVANDVNSFASQISNNPQVHTLFRAIRHVPLLMFIASRLIEHHMISPEMLQSKLEEAHAIDAEKRELSVSKVLKEMCNVIVDTLRNKYEHAQEWLTLISCVNASKISTSVLHALCMDDTNTQINNNKSRYYERNRVTNPENISNSCKGETNNGEAFLAEIVQFGLLQEAWEGNTYNMHPTVQHVFQQYLTSTLLESAGETIVLLWPRRRGRFGEMSIATELVEHTRYLVQLYMAHSLRFTSTVLTCMDRSATYLCQYIGQQLDEAAELWYAVHQHNVHTVDRTTTQKTLSSDSVQTESEEKREQQQKNEKKEQSSSLPSEEKNAKVHFACTPESVRVAWECGRLMCKLRDSRAEKVLESALDQACQLYSCHSTQVALILGCLASYLPATHHNVELLFSAAKALDEECQMVEEVRSKEERTMLLETLFILLARQAQMLSEIDQDVPVELEKQAKSVYELLSRREIRV